MECKKSLDADTFFYAFLAKRGVVVMRTYAYAACSPVRSDIISPEFLFFVFYENKIVPVKRKHEILVLDRKPVFFVLSPDNGFIRQSLLREMMDIDRDELELSIFLKHINPDHIAIAGKAFIDGDAAFFRCFNADGMDDRSIILPVFSGSGSV